MILEVDPFEALINLAKANADIIAAVGTQVDIFHHYNQESGGWAIGSPAIVFTPNGGHLNQTNHWFDPTLLVRCYGSDPYDCGLVWRAMVAFTVEFDEKRVIAVTGGTALVYRVLPLTGQGMPILLYDEDVEGAGGMPFYQLSINARISSRLVG